MNPKVQAIEKLIDFDLRQKLKEIDCTPINIKNWLIEFYLRGWKERDKLIKIETDKFTIT
jgi:hypothetical protein